MLPATQSSFDISPFLRKVRSQEHCHPFLFHSSGMMLGPLTIADSTYTLLGFQLGICLFAGLTPTEAHYLRCHLQESKVHSQGD